MFELRFKLESTTTNRLMITQRIVRVKDVNDTSLETCFVEKRVIRIEYQG